MKQPLCHGATEGLCVGSAGVSTDQMLRIAYQVEVQGEQTEVVYVYITVAIQIGAGVVERVARGGVEGVGKQTQIIHVHHIVVIRVSGRQSDHTSRQTS